MATRPLARSRVLYICGWGRSGTTIVDRILGQAPGFTSVGELRSLWDSDPGEQKCGCGEVVTHCELWGPLLSSMEAATGYTTRTVQSMRDQTARTRHLPRLYRSARRRRPRDSRVPGYGDVLSGIYQAVLAATRSGVVVDSSKHPAEALLLAARPDIDLTVLHLVRDPRAVAYSWEQSPEQPGDDEPPRHGALHSATWWTAWNASIEMLIRPRLGRRYVSLRYEDVMEDPAGQLGLVLQRFGRAASDLPFVTADDVLLAPSHTVAGNPSRMRNGEVHLSPDRRWETEMLRGARRKATMGALPLMGHYGYPVRPPAVLQSVG
jgi:hypothetical protein